MSAARQQAISDIDTQLLYAVPPQTPSGNTGAAGVRGAATTPLPGERTTGQYPTERLFLEEPPTILQPAVPNYPPGQAPPPPKSSQGNARAAQTAQRQQLTMQQRANIQYQRVLSQAGQTASSVGRFANQNGSNINRWLGNIPTPGTIWLPFFLLLFVFLILIKVGNHSRLNWLWLAFIGHAYLNGVVPSTDTGQNVASQDTSTSTGLTIIPFVANANNYLLSINGGISG